MTFRLEIDSLVTMWTHLPSLCKKLHVNPVFTAGTRTKNLDKALKILTNQLVRWGQKTFPCNFFGDDNIVAHFVLRNAKNEIVLRGAVPIVWEGSVSVYERINTCSKKNRANS